MIAAVDTNILLDILVADKKHFEDSKALIDQHLLQGRLILSEVVYAELASQFASEPELNDFLTSTSITLVHSSPKALALAGERWAHYAKRKKNELQCTQCGRAVTVHCKHCDTLLSARQHIITDFIIGAHALVHADRLLSRDRGFYKTYFKDVDLMNK